MKQGGETLRFPLTILAEAYCGPMLGITAGAGG